MSEAINIADDLLEYTSRALKYMDPDDSEDNKIILGLLECCETALKLPTKKRKWIKSSREERKLDSFSFMSKMKDLNIDENKAKLLLALVKTDLTRKNTLMRGAIPPDVRLAAILRSIITGESYRSTDFHTGLSQSFICGETPRVCHAIWKNLKDTYLKFPNTTTEWENIAMEFEKKWQFPNCIGALHVKHIRFRCRRTDAAIYRNDKGESSIILLVLVDANCRFVYVDVGCNGSTNHIHAYEQSSLRKVLEKGGACNLPKEKIIDNHTIPYVMVGGETFPLKRYLMKPFAENIEMCEERKVFNKRLHRARSVVEEAFGLLFNRFHIFQNIMNLRVENIEVVTMACCVLHNFLLHNDKSYQQLFQHIPNENTEDMKSIQTDYNTAKPSEEAVRIRQDFVEYFYEQEMMSWICK